MLKLKCPRGLQEADFLDLLKSTFPQLSGDNKCFDILTSDKRRRLQPLKLKKLTPEEIHRNISCTGWGKSMLYIRLRVICYILLLTLKTKKHLIRFIAAGKFLKVGIFQRWNRTSLFFQTQKEPQANEEEIHQTKDNNTEDSQSSSAMLAYDETRPQTR